jgi:uncharacterized protein YdiU (UPF0061 family)
MARLNFVQQAEPAEMLTIAFDNSYARLPDRFHASVEPDRAPAPRLIRLNRPLADELDLDAAALASPEGIAMLSGGPMPDGAAPVAMAYAGHQFGQFVPSLGDGRAVLIGEVVDRAGRHRDLHLKGAGRTVFSRRGDGKAALGPVLREYLVGEAMAALGLPTTRVLAAIATGEPVYRDGGVRPGGVLTRVALSHVRVGTFQYFAARRDDDGVRILADHVIDRLYPDLAGRDDRHLELYREIVGRQARLVAGWLAVGFVHGVMNTDNMAVSGETIDYGPCAFMDTFDPAMVLSSIDQGGRYAYGNQPAIAQWNLARLGECLLPLLGPDRDAAVARVVEVLTGFAASFETAYHDAIGAKMALTGEAADRPLANDFLRLMQSGKADFTLAFRRLADTLDDPDGEGVWLDLFADREDASAWLAAWRRRVDAEGRPGGETAAALRRVNPLLIPRNHVVEAALAAAVEEGDDAPFQRLADELQRPFDDRPGIDDLVRPPREEERVLATFCGT